MKDHDNRITLCQIILSILSFLFIFSNICCAASSNDLLRLKEDIESMRGQLKFDIELDKQVYKIEEPIIIKCKISNASENIINLHPIIFMSLEVYLKHEDSTNPSSIGPTILLNELVRKDDIVMIKPGASHSSNRVISKEMHYIMPSKTGRYGLYVIYSNLTKELGGIKLWVGEIKSNTAQLEIENQVKG